MDGNGPRYCSRGGEEWCGHRCVLRVYTPSSVNHPGCYTGEGRRWSCSSCDHSGRSLNHGAAHAKVGRVLASARRGRPACVQPKSERGLNADRGPGGRHPAGGMVVPAPWWCCHSRWAAGRKCIGRKLARSLGGSGVQGWAGRSI